MPEFTFAQQALLNAISPAATLALAALAGQPLAAYWSVRQKRREFTISAANEFYRLYGEFFAVWKLWQYVAKHEADAVADPKATHWALLQRAAAAEAGVESLLVKLAAERQMSPEEMEVAGRYRQAFQTLRQVIRRKQRLDWYSSEHPQYVAFKTLACHVASLIETLDRRKRPTPDVAQSALLTITSNRWENVWWELGPRGDLSKR